MTKYLSTVTTVMFSSKQSKWNITICTILVQIIGHPILLVVPLTIRTRFTRGQVCGILPAAGGHPRSGSRWCVRRHQNSATVLANGRTDMLPWFVDILMILIIIRDPLTL